MRQPLPVGRKYCRVSVPLPDFLQCVYIRSARVLSLGALLARAGALAPRLAVRGNEYAANYIPIVFFCADTLTAFASILWRRARRPKRTSLATSKQLLVLFGPLVVVPL